MSPPPEGNPAPAPAPGRAFGHAIPNVAVGDVRAAVAFYRDKMGFEVEFEQYGEDDQFVIVERDSAKLFIVNCQCKDRRHVGNAFLSIETEDVMGVYEELSAAGVPTACGAPVDHPFGLREFTALDPDGTWISFFGPIPEEE